MTRSLNGRLNLQWLEKNWFSKDYTKLRQTWRRKQRKIRILFFMRSIRSSSPNDYSYNRRINWADQAQRDKTSLHGELKVMNRLFREHQAKGLPRNWRIEENLLRRCRSSETSKNFLSCPRLRVNCWSDAKEFSEKQRAALERPTFPVNPLLFRVPEQCFAAILDCRTIQGITWVLQETYLNDYLLKKDKTLVSSTFQEFSIFFSKKKNRRHAVKFPKGAWHKMKIRERKGPSPGIIQKSDLITVVLASPNSGNDHLALNKNSGKKGSILSSKLSRSANSQFRERSHQGTIAPRKMRPQSSMGFLEQLFTYARIRKNSYWSKDDAGNFKKSPEEREFAVNSEASMHMMRKKTYAQMNWILCEDPGTLCHSYSQWRGAQTRKPKYTFIILISSWQCKYSTKRLLFLSLGTLRRPQIEFDIFFFFFNWDQILKEVTKKSESEMRRELQHSSTLVLRFWSGVDGWIILVELMFTVVWLIFRDFRFRNCTCENFLAQWNFSSGKSTSKLRYVQNQQILISQCNWSKKLG